MYKNVIAIDDPPANAAPSLHVGLTCLLLLAMLRDYPRCWPLWVGFVSLVWLSTLVTRQHHLIDVATGILLACAVVGRLQRRGLWALQHQHHPQNRDHQNANSRFKFLHSIPTAL
jgi:membrane-associated phospholipid phosphatase